jgi:hypothetical protein
VSNILDKIKERLIKAREELEKKCGPLEKDEIDEKIKAKLKAEMDRRNFGEADAARHVIDRDRGNKQPKIKQPKPLLQSESDEVEKSNYGPKGMGLYNPKDNIKRKANRTGEEVEGVGQNKAVHNYTTSGSSVQAAHEAAEAKRQKIKSKASVRTMADMSPEEIQAIKDKYNKTASEDGQMGEVIKYDANGQWRIEKAEKLAKPAPKGIDEGKYDRCVDDVKGQKGDKNAYAVCAASLKKDESEPHKDDPKHEEKEQKKAKTIKEKAQEILDMHKGK